MLVLGRGPDRRQGAQPLVAFRGAPPQRKARLYTALVERGLASSVSGSLLPTADPFLFTLSADGGRWACRSTALEEAALAEIERAASEAG